MYTCTQQPNLPEGFQEVTMLKYFGLQKYISLGLFEQAKLAFMKTLEGDVAFDVATRLPFVYKNQVLDTHEYFYLHGNHICDHGSINFIFYDFFTNNKIRDGLFFKKMIEFLGDFYWNINFNKNSGEGTKLVILQILTYITAFENTDFSPQDKNFVDFVLGTHEIQYNNNLAESSYYEVLNRIASYLASSMENSAFKENFRKAINENTIYCHIKNDLIGLEKQVATF